MRLPLFVAFSLFACAPAFATSITVQNDETFSVKSISAWPSDLIPRSDNLLDFPLGPGQKQAINLINDWNDCVFTVEVTWQSMLNPAGQANKILALRYPDPIDYRDVNICKDRNKTISLHRPKPRW